MPPELATDLEELDDLRVCVSPGCVAVTIRGEIDYSSAPGLRDELLHVLHRRGPHVTIDLGAVTFLDCAGVSVLLATRRRAQLEGGSVCLVRVPPRVRRLIKLLNLESAFGLSR